ncbi:ABC transporter ATP-binding protein [Marinicrinis lubricantis]|uniref:ABC transporter ATP-binding protein n=1 Tax=Marinicrinis lubricantis TaxID=2086470 RepID=A0ABW1IM25_9BACL
MDVFRQLKRFYWRERKFLFTSVLFLILATIMGLAYPLLLRYLVDDIIQAEKFDMIPSIALLVAGAMVTKACFQFIHGFTGGRLGNRVAFNLREALYEKLQYLSFQYYDRARTGDLMSRLTADLEAIRNFVGFGFAQLLNMILMVTFGAVTMAFIDWRLTLITLITMPIMGFIAIRFELKVHPAFRSIRLAMSRLTTAVQENIMGVRTVKSFAREPFEVEKFSERNNEYRENHIETSKIWAKFFPALEMVANLSVVVLLSAGGWFVIKDWISVGDLVALFSLVWYIIGPMWGLGFHINNYTQSKASGERILEILNQRYDVASEQDALMMESEQVKGNVEFRDVQFHYPDGQPALKNFKLNAPAGSIIGLLGGTGSGKSTVIQLLMRAYDVKKGAITLDGVDIRHIDLNNLREQISVVFQETFLFSASILTNITYGCKEVTMEQVMHAAKLAKAHDFIMELPEGYNTVVGERGMGLSGGQKQRIAIARALLKNPKVLVLDDATSAVDMETEYEIQQGLKELMRGRTTFIIAHRISSLKHADEILVLDKGEIVQRGKHHDLVVQDGPYRHVFDIQFADMPEALRQGRKVAN